MNDDHILNEMQEEETQRIIDEEEGPDDRVDEEDHILNEMQEEETQRIIDEEEGTND